MRRPLLLVSLSLAVLLCPDVLAQDQVQIQFQTDPVLVQTDTEIVFTVLTVPEVLSMTWQYQDATLGLWAGGNPVVNEVEQFRGRVTITATQLRIGGAQLRDAGNYMVEVIPLATTGMTANSRSIQLRVFEAVAGVSLSVPSVALEGGNISLSCTWTAGTETTVQWGKGGLTITADSSITISDGSLVISPGRRGDAGDYTCTVSNPVSARTATQSLTVYYGPDTPVLTKDTPKECVGGGDVVVGQSVRLTCVSDSLPPALFSWQREGAPVASSQPDSGVLSLQTLSTDESGRYVCAASNGITGGASEQGTDLAVVDTCLDAGEVAGIVIGCLLFIIIIVVLIIVCVMLRQREQQRQRDTLVRQKTVTNPRPILPVPQPNGAADLAQGRPPPLYHVSARTRNPERPTRDLRGSPQSLQLNNMNNSDTRQRNGRIPASRLRHNAPQNTNSLPHNGIDNPAFAHSDAQNVNTQQQNPNIVIQAGDAQGAARPPAVQVSVNTLPQTAQQRNNNTQMPTIHVNLNSYPTDSRQTQQQTSLSFNTPPNNAPHTLTDTVPSNPTMQSGPSYPDPIPTGNTHYNLSNTAQRSVNTQTYQHGPELRSDGASGRRDAPANSSHRQMPWDRLRGTPAYPSGTTGHRHTSAELITDTTDYSAYTSTDYTTHPPLGQTQTPNRSQHGPQSQRSRAPPGPDAPSADAHTRRDPSDLPGSFPLRVPQLEPSRHTHRSPHAQRSGAQQDIRVPPVSEHAPRQEGAHRNPPQAPPLMSQRASVGRSAASQGPVTQRGGASDARALADPNHLPLVPIPALNQTTPPVVDPLTQPPRQAGPAPVVQTSARPNPSNLTQSALQTHTERTKTFENRRQQTQAALLHPGAQAQHPPPPPPPVIPLAEFHTLPKERTQHRSPTRGPQPPRPPANIPATQRRLHVQQRQNMHRHPTAMHPTGHHHRHAHPGHGHTRGHGHPAHFTHPQQQQQAHRGRPR